MSILLPCCYFEDFIVLAEGEELDFFVAKMVKIEGEFGDLGEGMFILLAVCEFDEDLGEGEGT